MTVDHLNTLQVGVCAHRPIRDCPMTVDHQMVLNEKIKKRILMNASIQRIPFSIFAQTPHSDLCAQLAQLVEQRTENPRVSGSIPELGII